MAKRDISQEIFDFLHLWGPDEMSRFMEDVIPIFAIFQEEKVAVDPKDEENITNVKLMRYVYLLSYFAETYAGKLARIRAEHKNLWKRLEKMADESNTD